jgi:EH_Signature domain
LPRNPHFGRIDGQTSAFLLDFGKIVVVEFSARGNACYFYKESEFRRILPDFWTREVLPVDRLKKKMFSMTKSRKMSSLALQIASDWDGVHRENWQADAAQLLSVHGIRAY